MYFPSGISKIFYCNRSFRKLTPWNWDSKTPPFHIWDQRRATFSQTHGTELQAHQNTHTHRQNFHFSNLHSKWADIEMEHNIYSMEAKHVLTSQFILCFYFTILLSTKVLQKDGCVQSIHFPRHGENALVHWNKASPGCGEKMGKTTVPPLKFSFFFQSPKLWFSKSIYIIYIMYIDVGLCLKRWAQRRRNKFVGLSVSKSGQTHISYYLSHI